MTEPIISYSKVFTNLNSTNITEQTSDLPDPCPPALTAAWDFIYDVAQAAGASSGSITFHTGGQLVVLIYPGQPAAIG